MAPKITISVTGIRRLTLYIQDQGQDADIRLVRRAYRVLDNRDLVQTEYFLRKDNLGGTYLVVHTEKVNE